MFPWLNRYLSRWVLIPIIMTGYCGYGYALEIKPLQSDHMVIDRQQEMNGYRWFQGAAKKVSGRYFADKEERVNGMLHRQVWEIGADVDLNEAHQFIFSQVLPYNADVIFDCRGLDCGVSNVWANQLFGVSQLYGRDTEQDYTTVSFVLDKQPYILSVYTVQRGNRRVYQLVDMLALKGDVVPVSEVVGNIEHGHLAFNPEDLQDRRKAVELAVVRLAEHPELRLLIVGRSTGGSFSQNLEDSRKLAGQEKTELVTAGVEESRIDTLGIGDYDSDANGSLLTINSLVELWFR
ncbi:DUF4892 domain-containing protein [Gynuella sp.]|uniref:DUF4892 domain-containing protein n=2 Tax=Gynuella sp. TaxID=2969146 RepID=UPI003D0AA543